MKNISKVEYLPLRTTFQQNYKEGVSVILQKFDELSIVANLSILHLCQNW